MRRRELEEGRRLITVYHEDELTECEGATRYSTDEHNNLCVWGGRGNDVLLAVFAMGKWSRVVVEDADPS